MTDEEIDEILTFHWPMVLRRTMSSAADDWIKGFVRSVARHGKRRNWRPTARQAQIMRRLVSELGTAPYTDNAPILIEELEIGDPARHIRRATLWGSGSQRWPTWREAYHGRGQRQRAVRKVEARPPAQRSRVASSNRPTGRDA